jgi:hypothetical protein
MRARFREADPSARVPDALTAALVAVLALVAVYNAFHYPSIVGYDAESHLAYAHRLVREWSIPSDLRNYYTPPGFYLLAGGMLRLGEGLGMADPGHLGQLLDGALTVATAVLLVMLSAIVFPGRAWLRFAAVAFFACTPIVLKTAAMFHPQVLVAFLATLALVLCARMLRDREYGIGAALLLGIVVGAGQLVRSVGLWTLGIVCIALLAAVISRPEERRAALRALVIVATVGVLVALPWYVYLDSRYGNPIFGRSSSPAGETATGYGVPGRWAAPAPFRLVAAAGMPSHSLWFFVDPGLPEIVTAPQRGALPPRFWPILYTDMWGDYFGNWSWGYRGKDLTPRAEDRLTVQTVAGILPTLLAAAGVLALAALAVVGRRTRPELVVVPLTPLVALAGTLYYARSYATTDADTVKALFFLPAFPALALCFGFAAETLGSRSRWLAIGLAVGLTLSLAPSLAYGVW